MIDRTTLDLRIAEHATTAARIDQTAWLRQGHANRRPRRAALAELAKRFVPRYLGRVPLGKSPQEHPAAS